MKYAARALSLVFVVSVAAVPAAQAQRAETAAARRADRIAAARADRIAQRAAAGNQQALAKQVRDKFNDVMKRQLNLTDDQSRQLQAVDARFQPQRNQLQRDERQARLALRAAMQDTGGAPDQAKISANMAALVQAQHRRADLLDAEQKELAGFLTPLQRAKYQGLHDQLNKRVQELRKKAGQPEPNDMR